MTNYKKQNYCTCTLIGTLALKDVQNIPEDYLLSKCHT